jgi:F420-dependent oxidoreductase-like protein
MKVGLQLGFFNWPGSPQNIGPKSVEIAKTAEKAGFSSLWIMDHLFQVGQGFGEADSPVLEGYVTISYLAAVTQRMKLGLLVSAPYLRHPGLLIKMVTTLDILSGGRAYLGLGAGGGEREAVGMGIPFPQSVHERVERLEETLQIAKHLWRGERSPFRGKYHQLTEPINNPQPLSKPHPPILVAGEGEKKMLRLVAEYADACNFHLGTPLKGYASWMGERYKNRKRDLSRKLDVLKEHCNKMGRPYDEIERTVLATIRLGPDAMSPNEIVNLCQELAEMGFQHAILNIPKTDHEIEPIRIIGREVIPQVVDM